MNTPDRDLTKNEELINYLPKNPGRVLDVGCGQAIWGDSYKKLGAIETVGIEVLEDNARLARWRLDRVLCGNIETMELPFSAGYFDTIICSDIIEHLFDPWNTMRRLSNLLAPGGCVLATVPNSMNYLMVLSLLSGMWSYTDWGLMDRTHLRFFTIDEFQKLFHQAGLNAEALTYSVTPEAKALLSRIDPDQVRFAVKALFKALNPLLDPSRLDELDPILFYVYQYYVRGTKISER